jgi:hypothetical protein
MFKRGDNQVVEGTFQLYEVLPLVQGTNRTMFKRTENWEKYKSVTRDEDSGFQGGTWDSLFQAPDMKPFIQAKEDFAKKNITRNIITKLGQANKRCRKFSEHDGDWDMQKKWEMRPFCMAQKTQSFNRLIKIKCEFGVSGRVSQSEINKYGAIVWSIANILESCGIETEITYTSTCLDFDYSGNGCNLSVILKEFGKYTTPMDLARSMTANFFRRAIFGLECLAADYLGTQVHEGLGRPKERRATMELMDGTLFITPKIIQAEESDIEKKLLEAILSLEAKK